jgi:ribonuclease III
MSTLRQLQTLQKRIGYTFKRPELLRESLVHPSYLPEHPKETVHNQRLEFLGDAVLDLILSEKLFHLYPDEREGLLTQYRAILAKGLFLSDMGEELGLHRCLMMSRAEIQNQGQKRPSSLEDALEALVGAIYLDSDFPTVRDVVLGWYGDLQEQIASYKGRSNPKGRLQELVQPDHGNEAIRYETSATEGKAHERSFEVQLLINDKLEATGRGKTKKEAEEKAAALALKKWSPRRS